MEPELLAGTQKIYGHTPVVLNEPGAVFLVKSGSVSVCATTLKDGEQSGPRRPLFDCNAGEILLGSMKGTEGRALIAVALGTAEIVKLDGSAFAAGAPLASGGARLVEDWIRKLGQIGAQLSPREGPIERGHEREVSLEKGHAFQPEGVAWLRVRKGSACVAGNAVLTVGEGQSWLPLTDRLWLQADTEVSLLTARTEDVATPELLTGAAQLQAWTLELLKDIEEREDAQERERFRERGARARESKEDALTSLASILDPQLKQRAAGGAPLFRAARAVGEVLGIELHPPGASEQHASDAIGAIARASHVRVRKVILRDNWWRADCGPLLAALAADNRPVALLPTSATSYAVFDPQTGERHCVDAALARKLAVEAYMFYRPLPEDGLKPLQLASFVGHGRRKDLLLIIGAGLMITFFEMVIPQADAILIDDAIPTADRGLLFQMGLGLAMAALGAAVFELVQGVIATRFSTATDHLLQTAVWDRLLRLKMSFFRRYSIGELQSRVSAVHEIREKLGGTALHTTISATLSFLFLGQLFYYSAKLALLAACVALLCISVTLVAGYLCARFSKQLIEVRGNNFGLVVQLINGISKLRTAGKEQLAFGYWAGKFSREQQISLQLQAVTDHLAAFNTVVPLVSSVCLFCIAAESLTGESGIAALSTGIFMAFTVAYGSFVHGATDFSQVVVELLEVSNLWKWAKPILEEPPESGRHRPDPGRMRGRVALENICFRYRATGPLVLDRVSIRAEPGEFIALVGPSGCGKSTLFRLLLGFEEPESGTVYYDDQDLKDIDVYAVRRQLGVVLQNGRISAGSIFENISVGTSFTMSEAWEAARAAGLDADISAMPMGLHTIISEGGGNLSGGQRQRLLIARALALKPRILLFDEATSALDNRTQAVVSESLDRLQTTRIVIAHRLSTIRFANRIYVMERGRVIQTGTFEELSAREGLFKQLISRQTV